MSKKGNPVALKLMNTITKVNRAVGEFAVDPAQPNGKKRQLIQGTSVDRIFQVNHLPSHTQNKPTSLTSAVSGIRAELRDHRTAIEKATGQTLESVLAELLGSSAGRGRTAVNADDAIAANMAENGFILNEETGEFEMVEGDDDTDDNAG